MDADVVWELVAVDDHGPDPTNPSEHVAMVHAVITTPSGAMHWFRNTYTAAPEVIDGLRARLVRP